MCSSRNSAREAIPPFPRTCSHGAANEPRWRHGCAAAAPSTLIIARSPPRHSSPRRRRSPPPLPNDRGSSYLAWGIVGSLTTERLLLKEDMSEESFDLLVTADIVYGLRRPY